MLILKKYLIAIIWYLFIPVSLFAQSALVGNVRSAENNHPIPGAHVYIYQLKKGAVTDSSGHYEIRQLPKGTFDVRISHLSYQTITRAVMLGQGTSSELNATLQSHSYESATLLVTGSRIKKSSETPLNVDVIQNQQVRMKGHSSLWESLDALPGLSTRSNGPGIERPVIRGLSSNRIVILNNGTPYNYQAWDPESGLNLNGEGIEQVEIIKGPDALKYGSGAMGGVISLVDDFPAPSRTSNGAYTLKLFSNTEGINNHLSYKHAGDRFFWGADAQFDSHADYKAGEEEDIRNSRYNNLQLHLNGGLSRSWGTTRLTYQYNRHKNGIIETEPEGEGMNAGEEETSRKIEPPLHRISDQSLISKTNFLINQGQLELTLSYQHNNQQEVEPGGEAMASSDEGENDIDLTLNTFNYQLDYSKSLSNALEFSSGLQGDFGHNTTRGKEAFIPNADKSSTGLYGLLTWDLSNVILEGGLRYDIHHVKSEPPEEEALEQDGESRRFGVSDEINNNYGNLSGALGSTFQLNDQWNIKANIGMGYRPPNLAELTADGVLREIKRYEVGDNNLRSEFNIEGDLGTEYRTQSWSASVSAFYNIIDHYIYQEKSNIVVAIQNDPNQPAELFDVFYYKQQPAHLWGGEGRFSLHPESLNWLRFTSSADLVYGEFTRVNASYLPLIPAPEWRNTVRFLMDDRGRFLNPYFNITLDQHFAQKRNASFESETGAYILTNISLGTQIDWDTTPLQLSLNAYNLFNVNYTSHMSLLKYEGIPNMGRSINLTAHIAL